MIRRHFLQLTACIPALARGDVIPQEPAGAVGRDTVRVLLDEYYSAIGHRYSFIGDSCLSWVNRDGTWGERRTMYGHDGPRVVSHIEGRLDDDYRKRVTRILSTEEIEQRSEQVRGFRKHLFEHFEQQSPALAPLFVVSRLMSSPRDGEAPAVCKRCGTPIPKIKGLVSRLGTHGGRHGGI